MVNHCNRRVLSLSSFTRSYEYTSYIGHIRTRGRCLYLIEYYISVNDFVACARYWCGGNAATERKKKNYSEVSDRDRNKNKKKRSLRTRQTFWYRYCKIFLHSICLTKVYNERIYIYYLCSYTPLLL